MDLLIECNVELCKVNCQPCAEPNQVRMPPRGHIKNERAIAANGICRWGDYEKNVSVRSRFLLRDADILRTNFRRALGACFFFFHVDHRPQREVFACSFWPPPGAFLIPNTRCRHWVVYISEKMGNLSDPRSRWRGRPSPYLRQVCRY